ncbi:MAG: cytochrome b562 [Gemmatimonas sp.]
MKQRHIFAAVFCALAFASSANAQTDDKPTTPLGEQMKLINAAYRALNPLITAGNADSAIAKVAIIHKAAEQALTFEPVKKADVPAAEQEKFVSDFRTTLKSFIGDVEKLDAALKAGKMDDAKTLVAGLRMDQMDAHKQFRKTPPGGRGGPRHLRSRQSSKFSEGMHAAVVDETVLQT